MPPIEIDNGPSLGGASPYAALTMPALQTPQLQPAQLTPSQGPSHSEPAPQQHADYSSLKAPSMPSGGGDHGHAEMGGGGGGAGHSGGGGGSMGGGEPAASQIGNKLANSFQKTIHQVGHGAIAAPVNIVLEAVEPPVRDFATRFADWIGDKALRILNWLARLGKSK